MTPDGTGPGVMVLAALPLLLLLALVPLRRVNTAVAGVAASALALTLAFVFFGADELLIAVAVGKGLWMGFWIACVVGPAILLYQIARVAGADRIGRLISRLSDDPIERLLVVAWIAPSLIQGIAGFGAPIALVAPLMLALGYDRVRAVAYPLIGYCWSVTFGSMASSFYMAAVTARLTTEETIEFAARAGLTLGVLSLGCALALCVMEVGWRRSLHYVPFILAVGVPMAAGLVGVAILVPSLATVAAAGTGLLMVAVIRVARARRAGAKPREFASYALVAGGRPPRGPRTEPEKPAREDGGHHALAILAPYVALVAVAFPVFLVPASNVWVRQNLLVAPSFPSTGTSKGWENASQLSYTPIAVLAHPGTYIMIASLIGYIVYRRAGLWPRSEALGPILVGWSKRLPAIAAPVISLTVLASILIDSGMTTTMARGLAGSLGPAYILFAPALGAIGSFATGSTTSSNALLAALQAEAGSVLGVPRTALLTAQTVGGNVGNSLAPMVLLVGASSISAQADLGSIARRTLGPALALLGLSAVAVVGGILLAPH